MERTSADVLQHQSGLKLKKAQQQQVESAGAERARQFGRLLAAAWPAPFLGPSSTLQRLKFK